VSHLNFQDLIVIGNYPPELLSEEQWRDDYDSSDGYCYLFYPSWGGEHVSGDKPEDEEGNRNWQQFSKLPRHCERRQTDYLSENP
jgi:hypothetical protein